MLPSLAEEAKGPKLAVAVAWNDSSTSDDSGSEGSLIQMRDSAGQQYSCTLPAASQAATAATLVLLFT